MPELKWYRLTPKSMKGGEPLVVRLEQDELEDYRAYGYQVEEVVILTVREYEELKAKVSHDGVG